jgi:mRNA interferase RelE/StbE
MLSISLSIDSRKFVEGLENKPARQVYAKTLSLLSEPRPASSTELKGYPGVRRLRVGDFRVIYKILPNTIQVILIDNRADDEVYRRLERL